MQVMCIELLRHIVGNDEPNSTEFDHTTKFPVIDLLPLRYVDDIKSMRRWKLPAA